jgi:hypothetical protein
MFFTMECYKEPIDMKVEKPSITKETIVEKKSVESK